jgi:predicted MFS family arabinose efflux permease
VVRLAACVLLLAVLGVIWNSFGLFLVAVEADMAWSRAATSAAFGIFVALNALVAPLTGWLIMRFDSRIVLAGFGLLLAGGLAAASLVRTVGEYWLTFGLLSGIGLQAVGSYAVFTLIINRYPRSAASAIAVAEAGSGAGTFLGLPLVQLAIDAFGWRGAYLALAAVVAAVVVVVHLFVLPPVRRMRPAVERGPHRRAFKGGVAIIALAVAFLLGPAVLQGIQTQQVALVQDAGLSAAESVAMVSVLGLAICLWRLSVGWLIPRIGLLRSAGIAACAAAIALTVLLAITLTAASTAAVAIYVVTLAVGFSAQPIFLALATRKLSSPLEFHSRFAVLRIGSGIGAAIGPVVAGASYDLYGSYVACVVVLSLVAAAHFVGLLMAVRAADAPRPPAARPGKPAISTTRSRASSADR